MPDPFGPWGKIHLRAWLVTVSWYHADRGPGQPKTSLQPHQVMEEHLLGDRVTRYMGEPGFSQASLLPACTHVWSSRVHVHTHHGSANTLGHTPPSPNPQPPSWGSQGHTLAPTEPSPEFLFLSWLPAPASPGLDIKVLSSECPPVTPEKAGPLRNVLLGAPPHQRYLELQSFPQLVAPTF